MTPCAAGRPDRQWRHLTPATNIGAMAKKFSEFSFRPEIMRALEEVGYSECTPIQEKTMGPVMEGHDLTGMAETGSGKTAAFLLPILEKLQAGGDDPRAVVIAPTRELAQQVAGEAERLARRGPPR